MRRLIPAVSALLAAVLVAPAVAPAADPEKATVSAASPAVAWTGTLEHPYPFHNAFNYEPTAGITGSIPCEPPGCDTFTLDVADQADLAIVVQSEQTSELSLRIQAPDGSWTYHDGWSDTAKPTTVKLKKAAKGTYVVNVVARVFGSTNPTAVADTADYAGAATLAVAPAPVVSAPAPAVAPAPAGAPAPPAAKPKAKPSCKAKARKIKNAKKRKAALKRCARKRR
jgi:hypothetical protein